MVLQEPHSREETRRFLSAFEASQVQPEVGGLTSCQIPHSFQAWRKIHHPTRPEHLQHHGHERISPEIAFASVAGS